MCSFAYTLRSLFGCMGHSSLCNNNSGPSNHSPFCILSIDAPQLLKSASFLSVGQCLQTIPVSCGISAIFLTQLETKTFHAFLGLQIQYSATILSNHTFMEVIGNRCCYQVLHHNICGHLPAHQFQPCDCCVVP